MNPRVEKTLARARQRLLEERHEKGHWEGELSTSALSTATAVVALSQVNSEQHATLIEGGLRWLIDHQNPDGGWGDTVKSGSNISTTLLCWSALNLATFDPGPTEALATQWIRRYVGSLSPTAIVEVVGARYGKDRTFSVPILMLCALCGRLGDSPKKAWKQVLPLPFELAVFPRRWFAALRLPVVSYALPALIAIGYARFRMAPPLGPFRGIRTWAWPRASALLDQIQPTSGGFLEAAPLTSFVTMALAAAGEKDHPVVKRAIEFLTREVRPDGSWPIDTNLATWVTTLSVKALGASVQSESSDFHAPDRAIVRQWLLDQQYRDRHPFTDAAPGGWAWTDLPGGVPDADDTPGALLALRLLEDDDSSEACREAAEAGVTWLLDLQNRDGGLPTFCRGWGALPFDRSSPDLTAHTLRAWWSWHRQMPAELQSRLAAATRRAIAYLGRQQRSDGSWVPLWFGNQHLRRDEENPTYGTAKVLMALAAIKTQPGIPPDLLDQLDRGVEWLSVNQNDDGGWGAGHGTPSSIEETALALDALARVVSFESAPLGRAAAWLAEATREGEQFPASPIGFYFAKLWYFEHLYPLIWTVSALESHARLLPAKRIGFPS